MKILVDENMPFAETLFHEFGEVVLMAGRNICADDLVDIDALLIRSVTKVNEALLTKANRLKFVGTATAGIDHVDTNLLAERGIEFAYAPGCNKVGVAEYVLSALFELSLSQAFDLKKRVVGIVGAGEVGTYLSQCLEALSIPYLLCDPFKQASGDPRQFFTLSEIIAQSDVITLHTPLTTEGDDATYHLIDEEQLKAMSAGTILINAARGAVVHNQALKRALQTQDLHAVLDVYECEPLVDIELMCLLAFATPHIAGYGLEGKARGTLMIYQGFCEFFSCTSVNHSLKTLLPVCVYPLIQLNHEPDLVDVMNLCRLIYDIRRDDVIFRTQMSEICHQDVNFDQMRKKYWDRREYSAITLSGTDKIGLKFLNKLGFTTEETK